MCKRIFAVICATLVIALSVVPCFAATWAVEAPVYDDFVVCSSSEAFSEINRTNIANLVSLAYEIGMFGGSKPVFILYCSAGDGTGWYIDVMVPTISTAQMDLYEAEKDRVSGSIYGQPRNGQIIPNYNSVGQKNAIWRLSNSGDWYIVEFNDTNYSASSAPYLQLSDAAVGSEPAGARKASTYWRVVGNIIEEWKPASSLTSSFQPFVISASHNQMFANESVEAITAKYQRQKSLLIADVNILDRYDEGYTDGYRQGFANGSPNLLNIPSIFDSMFDGVRSIMTAFDVELFGISIIGTLVAVLVIAIIAFVVRKLWK